MFGALPSIDDPPFGTTGPDVLLPDEPAAVVQSIDGLTPQQEAWWSQWWAAYWLHKAKKVARKAFGKHVKSVARFQQVMAATEAQTPEMVSRELAHRPHGATWLNGERWFDEAAADVQAKRTERDAALDRVYGEMQASGVKVDAR